MAYNYSYELCGAVVLAIIYLFLRIQYSNSIKQNIYFRQFVVVIMISALLDMGTAILGNKMPNRMIPMQVLLNTVYFIWSCFGEFMFFRYIYEVISERVDKISKGHYVINIAVIMLNTLWCFSNVTNGSIFYFDENGTYTFGKYHIFSYAPALYFLIYSLAMIIVYRKVFTKIQVVASSSFILWIIFGSMLQAFVVPDVLLSYAAATMGILVMVFTHETPDYQKLMMTMEALEKARAQADAASTAKTDFLNSISSDLQVPMNNILGVNALIINESSEENIKEYSREIEETLRGMQILLKDSVDISRLDTGKLELFKRKYRVAKLIRESMAVISVRATDKGLDLQTEINPNMPKELIGDDIRIRQILSKLLTNSVRCTKEGYIKLKVYSEMLEQDRIRLFFEIEDTGMGILQADLDKIWGSGKGNIEYSDSSEVFGLGLIKRLVELMEGHISAEGNSDSGTIFKFDIIQNVKNKEIIGDYETSLRLEKELERKIKAGFTAPRAKVLVVDDIPMTQKVIVKQLTDKKIKADTANDGYEALKLIESEVYDLIFLDYKMPGLNGSQTIAAMREIKDNPNQGTPIIMLTSDAISTDNVDILGEGYTDYIIKPVQSSALKGMLLQYIPADYIKWNLDENIKDKTNLEADETARFDIISGERLHNEEELSANEEKGFEERYGFLNLEIAERECHGNWDLFDEMAKEFIIQKSDEVLDYAVNSQNWEEYRSRVHSLVTSARMIGAENVATSAEMLEKAASMGDGKTIEEKHEAFRAEIANLKLLLEEAAK